MGERLIAAVAGRHGWLSTTIRRVGGACQTHMDMVCVAIPGAHLGHPGFVLVALDPAELFFYRSIDQDPFDLGLLGGGPDEGDVSGTPDFAIDIFSVRG